MRPKNNPFATRELLKIDYFLTEDQWADVLKKLHNFDYRASVVGKHGSGKTTFLEGLAERFLQQDIQIIYLSSENSRLSFWQVLNKLLLVKVLIVDGFQTLGILSGYILFYSAKILDKGLLVSQHRPSVFPVLLDTVGTEETLFRILSEINIPLELDRSELLTKAKELFIQENANIREVLLKLYDYSAGINCEERIFRADSATN